MGKRTLSLPSGEVEVDIARSSRRTVALYVRPGGTLLIRAPWYVPVRILMQFASQKSAWIERQVVRLRNVIPPGKLLTITDGSVIPFMGRELDVKVVHGSVKRAYRVDEKLTLVLPGSDNPDELTRMAESWYLREAKAYLPRRTRELAAAHSHLLPAPSSVNIRKMKRRWGTCHTGRAIWLNRELMKKDPELIDYVIIHELCHLVHHNHGKDYYTLLGRIVPDFRELRRRLQEQAAL